MILLTRIVVVKYIFLMNGTAVHTVLPSLPALPERSGSISSHLIFHVFIRSSFSNCCFLNNANDSRWRRNFAVNGGAMAIGGDSTIQYDSCRKWV